jgi:hypothetical protein
MGWYDVSASTTEIVVDSSAQTLDSGAWAGTYTTYNDTVCLSSDNSGSQTSCVTGLTFGAVSALTEGDTDNYPSKGILGLGKLTSDDSCFIR